PVPVPETGDAAHTWEYTRTGRERANDSRDRTLRREARRPRRRLRRRAGHAQLDGRGLLRPGRRGRVYLAAAPAADHGGGAARGDHRGLRRRAVALRARRARAAGRIAGARPGGRARRVSAWRTFWTLPPSDRRLFVTAAALLLATRAGLV